MRICTLPLLVAAMTMTLGCSSTSRPDDARNGAQNKPAAQDNRRAQTPPNDSQGRAQSAEMARSEGFRNRVVRRKALENAYERGVRDILEDFRGRTRASEGFTYEPPVIEYIEMPARAINGAVYPSHEQPVIYRSGRWVERNGAQYPTPPGSANRRQGMQGSGGGAPPSASPSSGGSAERAPSQRVYTGQGPYPEADKTTPCCGSDQQ